MPTRSAPPRSSPDDHAAVVRRRRVDDTCGVGQQDDAARAALERCEWAAAYALLAERTGSGTPSIDEMDWLGTAAYLTGRDEEGFDWWIRAHRACLEAGDAIRAARLGVQLSGSLAFKGDIARSRGWVERARHALAETDDDCVEHGYLEHAIGMLHIFEAGDITGARDAFVRSAKVADRFADRELRTLSLLGEGRCLIYLGELAEGLALLDEAMVSVEAGEVAQIVVGDAYCTVIDACHELFDTRRCQTWTDSFTRWCDAQPDLVLYRGHCLLHRAEILQLHGRWVEGVEAAKEACRRLAEPVNLMTLGGAHYLEAELHRLRGDVAAAAEAYERAHQAGCDPHPGLSLLRLAQDRVDVADAAIRRVLAEAEGPIARARLLGPYVEIVLAAGDVGAARLAADELTAVAVELGSSFLRAQAAQLMGATLIAEDDHSAALMQLRRAATAWAELDAPFESARTRLLIATACAAVGDHDGADMERKAAGAAFERLGRVEDRPAPAGLSPREIEVLALVAHGGTNRAIAEALFISEKTVTSHLTHIFTKLGVSSRSAATTFAHEHSLV